MTVKRKRRRRSTAANRYARDLSRRSEAGRLMAVDLLGSGWRKVRLEREPLKYGDVTVSVAEAIALLRERRRRLTCRRS